ncbi:MAG TPA: PEP-CTERM sorting domain-containing protein [Syntrophorhabdales bacterium]|nr:PEP-CTERM sorting domain-containing protein [Syntrophorhabdales bacterium]
MITQKGKITALGLLLLIFMSAQAAYGMGGSGHGGGWWMGAPSASSGEASTRNSADQARSSSSADQARSSGVTNGFSQSPGSAGCGATAMNDPVTIATVPEPVVGLLLGLGVLGLAIKVRRARN